MTRKSKKCNHKWQIKEGEELVMYNSLPSTCSPRFSNWGKTEKVKKIIAVCEKCLVSKTVG